MPTTLILTLILVLTGLSSQSQARSVALVSPPAQRHTRARQLGRLHAQLTRQLEALGIQVVDERVFAATARGLGLKPRTALQRASLPTLCDALQIDGVVILGLTRRGRMQRLSAFLFDAKGGLVLKRRGLQRRSRSPRRWLSRFAKAVDGRLDPALPTLEEVPGIGEPEVFPLVSVASQAGTGNAADPAAGAESSFQPAIEVGVESLGTSNLFSDSSERMDMAVHPWLDLGADLEGSWALGYRGEFRSWLRNEQLMQHAHRLYVGKGLNLGDRGQHSLVLLGSLDGVFNRSTYRDLDFLEFQTQALWQMDLADWLLAEAGGNLGGRFFVHDSRSSSTDAGLQAGLIFRLPADWSVSLSGRADARVYTSRGDGTGEPHDLQLQAALRLRGSLWAKASLWADASYRRAFGDSHQVQLMLAESQVKALGDTFQSTGHRAGLGVVQRLGERSRLSAGVRFEQNDYAGWPALDAQGQDMGKERKDRRLGPLVAYGYGWWPEKDDGSGLQFEYRLRVEYGFTRQWSNGPWTDTAAHTLGLQLQGSW